MIRDLKKEIRIMNLTDSDICFSEIIKERMKNLSNTNANC